MLIENIKPNKNNPRTISSEKLQKLRKSIKDFSKMMELRPIIIDENNEILGGNMRYKALKELGYTEIPDAWVKQANELTAEEKERFVIEDNVGFGEWDWEILQSDWDLEKLAEWGLDVPNFDAVLTAENKDKLREKFLVPPFSVLDSKQGYWTERKKLWRDIIKDNGETREERLIIRGVTDTTKYGKDSFGSVSLLDPVLAEVVNYWFAIPGGEVFDPFAGDSVYGYVSGFMGYKFKGIELRKEQAELNQKRLVESNLPGTYFCDDALNIDEHIENETQDFMFTCPPYYDLEEYSDLEEDLSNLETYEQFNAIIAKCIERAVKKLKQDRFAVCVVGEIRDKNGIYRNFVSDTITNFTNAGMQFYNDIVLLTPIGTAGIRAARNFNNRKITKVHQNVLVFYKGDVKKIKDSFGKIEIGDIEEYESEE